MSSKNALLEQARRAADVEDQTQATGGFERELPEKGRAPARFVGYVELGTHPQPAYQGTAKDPCIEVQLTFEVFGSKNTREIEVKGKKKKAGRLMSFRTTKKINERAKFYKLLNKMRGSRGDITNMAEMLNEVFLVTISHKEAKSGKKYATFQNDSTYDIGAPVVEQVDAESGDIVGHIDLSEKTPPASVDLQLFLLAAPTLEQWKSIEIEGTYEKTTDEAGKETTEEVSKNFLQNMIQDALDWEGSAMEAILLNLDEEEDEEEDVPEEETAEEEDEPEEEVEEEAPKQKAKSGKKSAAPAKSTKKKSSTSKAKTEKVTKSAKTVSPSEEEEESEEDLLASMGL